MSIVAYETNVGWDFTLPCNTDLSSATAAQYFFVNLQSTGYILVNTVSGGPCVGILQQGGVGTTGQPIGCQVRMGGPSKVVCGGTFSPGDLLASDNQGRAVKYAGATVFTGTPYQVSGSMVLGVALAAGAVNDYSTILFNPQGLALISVAA